MARLSERVLERDTDLLMTGGLLASPSSGCMSEGLMGKGEIRHTVLVLKQKANIVHPSCKNHQEGAGMLRCKHRATGGEGLS